MGGRASCTGGRQSDGYRANQRPVDRFVGWVQPIQITFSDQPEPGPGPGGRMRAGTRRPSPCRASIGWVREDQSGSTGKAHGSIPGGSWLHGAVTGRISDLSRCVPGWASMNKKDNAGLRILDQPGRALEESWCPCPGHRLPATKKDFFLHPVQPPFRIFQQSPDGYPVSFMLPYLFHA